MRRRFLASLVAVALLTSACAVINPPADVHGPDAGSGHSAHASPSSTPSPSALRQGERFLRIGVADSLPGGVYAPSAPDGGTDDYRCFLVDPAVTTDSFVTGVQFLPGNPAVVHHSILFRVLPAQVSAAEAKDASDDGPGWQCFGGPGLPSTSRNPLDGLDAAPWLAGWAPGGHETLFASGTGVPLPAGGRIVIQMHYNLRAVGSQPVQDDTHVSLRVSSDPALIPLRTMLLPAPVELPCPDGVSGTLCDRGTSVADVTQRFGPAALRTIGGLQLLCGGDMFAPRAGTTQSCVRDIRAPVTVRAAAGHMHLLGRSIRMVANEGTARAHVLLDIPVWDFDNQSAKPLAVPLRLVKGDTVTVTCTHDPALREKLPALANTPPRYVVWGEGTTDEMCLGILIVSD